MVGFNQFVYCINNPIRYHDVCGDIPEEDCVGGDPEETLFPDKDALGPPPSAGYGDGSNITLYRSVGTNELQDIKSSGQFNISERGMQCKQFGFSEQKTAEFGQIMGHENIVSVNIPAYAVNLFDLTGVDRVIFRSGTLTVHSEMLGVFNQLIQGSISYIAY